MIAIIDYGMGNLRSAQKAIEYIGQSAVITDQADVILSADRVILPGVGAFGDAIAKLRETGLDEVVLQVANAGTPLLGICIGMQLMFEYSTEFGLHKGLGIFPGTISRFPDVGLKVPHMGWNTLSSCSGPLLSNLENPCVYFVHSFGMMDETHADCVAKCEYGVPFTAAVQKNNVAAVQFHPEKSGDTGLEILRRFAAWNPERF